MAPAASFVWSVREHLVAGERGFDGDIRRLVIANFTDHDDVRILAQDGTEGAGEIEADVALHRHLVDAGELVLDGVLDGDDVVFRAVQLLEDGIERGRLAGAGRAGDEDHPVRRVDGICETV